MIGGCFSILYLISTIFMIYSSKWFDVVKRYIPLKSVVIWPRDKPWMNSEVRWAICEHDRLLHIHNIRQSPQSDYS
jgi:transposase